MESKGFFIFDGVSSASFGLFTAGSGTYNSPERDITEFTVPGRNGVLTRDNGRFGNVKVVYTILLKDGFTDLASDVKAWLLSRKGYCRLEDSFNTSCFRKARFSGSVDWTISELLRYGYCDVEFDCMPELYLKSGELENVFTASGTITNPTEFAAKPLIRVKGSDYGTVTIGDYTIILSSINEYVDIDCDIQDVFRGTSNLNAYATLSNGFPKLEGTSDVSFSGGVTSVSITGRWWKI